MPYDINEIRNSIKKAVNGKFTDPDEFKPDKAKDGAELKYRFFILPPLRAGDVLKSGEVSQSMDNFFLTNGQHWINEKPHACPRVWDGSDCDVCQYGFDLLKECKEKKYGEDRKKSIVQTWMPSTYYMVNIFFTNWKGNPEDLRGKVKYYNAPKTCLDKWMATLMKDDKGDPEDPEAYGVFFDEANAFCFELVATKDGKSNGYKTSSFIKNNGVPVPMIMNEDRSANVAKLKQLLSLRIDLFSKVDTPDPSKIKRLANTLIHGDDEQERSSGGFDNDETAEPPPSTPKHEVPSKAVSEGKKSMKPVQARQETPKATATAPLSDDDDDVVSNLSNSLADEGPSEIGNKPSADDDIGGDDIDALLSQLDD